MHGWPLPQVMATASWGPCGPWRLSRKPSRAPLRSAPPEPPGQNQWWEIRLIKEPQTAEQHAINRQRREPVQHRHTTKSGLGFEQNAQQMRPQHRAGGNAVSAALMSKGHW